MRQRCGTDRRRLYRVALSRRASCNRYPPAASPWSSWRRAAPSFPRGLENGQLPTVSTPARQSGRKSAPLPSALPGSGAQPSRPMLVPHCGTREEHTTRLTQSVNISAAGTLAPSTTTFCLPRGSVSSQSSHRNVEPARGMSHHGRERRRAETYHVRCAWPGILRSRPARVTTAAYFVGDRV
jgi:hypothetical protein